MELVFLTILAVVVIGFLLEFLDGSAGMGFGIATPVLILLGFNPLTVIPTVLFCTVFQNISVAYFHNKLKNIEIKQNSRELKTVFLLSGLGILAVIIGASVAINIPEWVLKSYISLLVIIIGVLIILGVARKGEKKERLGVKKASFTRIAIFGSIASFNKGISGGGYGPILTGGQILSGVKGKKAVGITSITEGIVSLVGTITYIIINPTEMNWVLTLSLLTGGLLATPLAAFVVKKVHPKKFKKYLGVISLIVGIIIFIKTFW